MAAVRGFFITFRFHNDKKETAVARKVRFDKGIDHR